MNPDEAELLRLGDAQYLLLTTYRKDGTPVATPLWVVRDGDAVAVWTPTDSWKVKRIRRNPKVEVAPCEFNGKPTGEAVPGTAEILDGDATERVRGAIKQKYGIMGRITMFGSRLRRGTAGTVGIRVTLG